MRFCHSSRDTGTVTIITNSVGLPNPNQPLYALDMIRIRHSRPDDGEHVIAIWRRAVDATHDFLSPDDRQAIDDLVCSFLPQAQLHVAANTEDLPIGFMLIYDGHMEALFVDPASSGAGIGKALVRHGLELHPNLTTDVNEQNGRALGFYEHMGFKRIGRSPVDGQGRPYLLIHLVCRVD